MTSIAVSPELFEGVVSFERHGEGLSPVRLPIEQELLFPSTDEMLMNWARAPSGVRLRFATDSSKVIFYLDQGMPSTELGKVDLVWAGNILETRNVTPGVNKLVFRLGFAAGPRTFELWLDLAHPVRVVKIEINEGSTFAIPSKTRRRWTAYGSSITMCRTASSPAQSWPAVAARHHDLNLTSLGFGGQCHLEPMVARVLRDIPADIITLKLGINVYERGSLNARTYPAAVIGMVQIIRERHSLVPIGVITPIFSGERETTPNVVGSSLENYREMTRDAVRRMVEWGDENLVLFEGLNLFGPEEASLLPDGLHPNGEGYRLMGQRAAEQVLPPLLALSKGGE